MKNLTTSILTLSIAVFMSFGSFAKDTYATISYKTYGGSVECLQVDFFEDGTARMTSYNADGLPTKVVSGSWGASDRMTYFIMTFTSNDGYRTSFEAMKGANGRPSSFQDGQGREWRPWGC